MAIFVKSCRYGRSKTFPLNWLLLIGKAGYMKNQPTRGAADGKSLEVQA